MGSRFSAVSTAVIACLAATAAAAADNAGTDPASTGFTLQEVVVTAEKVSSLAQQTPIAMNVVTGSALLSSGVTSVSDLQNIVPSLNVGVGPAGPTLSIRGIATTDVTSKGNQDIAFNVDGIYQGRPREQGLAMFDVSRVEVLYGPQGTLYGHSATGGAINVVTNAPIDKFDASGSLELGNYNERNATGMINVPLTDTLYVRVAAVTDYHDGYLQPVLGTPVTVNATHTAIDAQNDQAVRSSVLWAPTDDISLRLTSTDGHLGGPGSNYTALYDRYQEGGSSALDVYYDPMGDAMDDSFHNLNAEFNAAIGPVHVAYDGAYQHYVAHDNDGTYDGTPAVGDYTWRNYFGNYSTTEHELRFSNEHPGFLDWVAGADYFKEFIRENDQNWATYVAPNPGNSCFAYAPNLDYGCNSPNPIIVGPSQHKSEGVFGQGNLHMTKTLTLTLGARYSHDSMFRNATVDGGGVQPPTCYPPNNCANGGEPDVGSESASKVTWRVGLSDQLTPTQMVYGSVATGYKPGGFNDPTAGQTQTTTYGPEQITAYELGYKGDVTPSLQFDTDVYYYDFQKYQVTSSGFFGFGIGGPIILIFTKLAPATIYGWEGNVHYVIDRSNLIEANLAVERAYFGSLNVGFIPTNPVDWTGKSLDNTPRVQGTLAYEHRWFLGNGGFITARLQGKLSSSYFESDLSGNGNIITGDYAPAPAQYEQPSYHRTDFRLGYTTPAGNFDFYAFVRNIENRLQMTNTPIGLQYMNTYPDGVTVNVTNPRTFGVHMDWKLQ